jgi:hypothetical protein
VVLTPLTCPLSLSSPRRPFMVCSDRAHLPRAVPRPGSAVSIVPVLGQSSAPPWTFCFPDPRHGLVQKVACLLANKKQCSSALVYSLIPHAAGPVIKS